MILFFSKGEVDSDDYIKYCYGYYKDIMRSHGNENLPKEVVIIRDKGQKPKFDTDEAYFSLSHSNGAIMLAISPTEIGADIEHIREIDYKKFDFIDAEDLDDFYFHWTEREAYLKKIGVGIKEFRAVIPDDEHFEHFPVFEGYHACVCGEEQSIIAYEIALPLIK